MATKKRAALSAAPVAAEGRVYQAGYATLTEWFDGTKEQYEADGESRKRIVRVLP